MVALEVKGQQRKIEESAGENARCRHIHPKRGGEFLSLYCLRHTPPAGVDYAGGGQGQQRSHRGKKQPQKSGRKVAGPGDREHHQQRANHGAGLVHDAVQTEAPSVANRFRGPGKQHIACGAAQSFSGPLSDHQQRRYLPGSRICHGGDSNHVYCVTEESDGPVGVRSVGEAAREIAQTGGQHLPEARNESHLRGGGAKLLQIGSDNAVGPFVRHVGKEADDTEANNEFEGRATLLPVCEA